MYIHQNRKPSILSNNNIRQEVDQMLQHDYALLNRSQASSQAIFQCRIPNSNAFVSSYIKAIQQDYHLQNPLHEKSKTSNHKLKLSLTGKKSHLKQKYIESSKSKQKIQLTNLHKQANSQLKVTYENSERPQYKHQYQASQFQLANSNASKIMFKIQPVAQPQSRNKIQSKQKPQLYIKKSQTNYLTLKRTSSVDYNNQDNSVNTNYLSRRTIKKQPIDQYPQMQINSYDNLNPISNKIKKKNKYQQSRTRITIPINNTQPQISSNRIKDSYRYCIGCQLPILQANIKTHQTQCECFISISSLQSNQEILAIINHKISKLQQQIELANKKLDESDASIIRNSSKDIITESNKRKSRSPQSELFSQGYQKVMQVGYKWCNSIESINKLKWFLRVSQRLEQLILKDSL